MGYKDPKECKCGGRYKMAGYEGKRFYYVCDKCKDKNLLEFMIQGIKGGLEKFHV